MVSIIIPLYNKEKQIATTIQSVWRQTFQDYEIIIVNDGSTDNSVKEIEAMRDTRIRLIHQENSGVSAARNRGISEAKYELIAFLDADDEWKPQYLETQYELYRKYPNCSVYASNYEFRDNENHTHSTIIKKLLFDESNGILTNYFEISSYSHPPLWTSAVMVRKEAIIKVGCFPLGVKSGEDLLVWARLAHHFEIAYNRKPLSVYQLVPDSLTDRPKRIPSSIDYVGIELYKLFKEKPSHSLRLYNSHWHKMRCSIYMRLNLRKDALKEGMRALKFNLLNYKIYIYILLTLLPLKCRRRILTLL
ncbi:MAG: glycosyltransferase family 2 protein [Cellulosilyticaceae bacterium]